MNNKLNLIIGIAGRMRAGKSTVARYLSATLDIPIVSFGAYLVHLAQENNKEPTRDLLQEMGNTLVQKDVNVFVNEVFSFARLNADRAIVEGIRHKSVIESLKNIAEDMVLIFIDVDQLIRYERYCSGQKISDKSISYEQFLEKDNHPVESEIESLKSLSEITCSSDGNSGEYIISKLFTDRPWLRST